MGRLFTAAILLGAAVVLGFVAHEPLLVLVGQRGVRAEKEDGPRARRLLAVLGSAALTTFFVGLWLSPSRARYAFLFPLALGAVLGVLVRRRLEKTLWGELLVASALCSAGAAVALAGGASPLAVQAALAAWLVAFTASTLAVHAVLARARAEGHGIRWRYGAGVVLLWALSTGLPFAGLSQALTFAAAPPLLVSLLACLLPVPARWLRPLGWTLAAASSATLFVLVLSL